MSISVLLFVVGNFSANLSRFLPKRESRDSTTELISLLCFNFYIELTLDTVDYPDYAEVVARGVASGEAERGILVCGSGIGMEIAANKVPGVRAALAWNEETAELARRHNDANIVAVGARTTPQETIEGIIRAFLTTDFEGGRHQRRIEKIKKLEEKNQ